MYAKLIDNALVQAPNMVRTAKCDVYNPSPELLFSFGYKPVIRSPYPVTEDELESKWYVERFEETETEIISVWEETNYPEPEYVKQTDSYRLDALEQSNTELRDAFEALLNGVTE